jgi:dTDP-4-amino-4,6-dideoxygalactose transaminase
MKIEVYSPTIRRKEMDAVLTAMVEEKIGPGDRNRLLIQTAKDQLKFDYALALRSPAVALHLALKALNVKQGQAVVISALSPRYYLQVLEDLQLTPLFCDVSFDFPCMSREMIESAAAKKPAGLEICAVVLHHTLGFLPDAASAAELGFPVIEDISQSYGSWLKTSDKKESTGGGEEAKKKEEAPVKTGGVFCILGLEERDMLTSGGGALLFAMNRRDGSVLRNFAGIADEYCLPDINAALAVVQFKEVQRNIERRRDIADVYIRASLRTRHKRFIPLVENEYNNFSFSLVLETGLKDVIAYAKKKEIALENAFENTIAGAGLSANCPVSGSLALRTVLFPMYPRLRSQDVELVSRLIMTLP